MQKETSTLFPYKAIYLIIFIVLLLPIYSSAQTPVVLPVPTQCDNGDPINLTDYVNDEDFWWSYPEFDISPGADPGLHGVWFHPAEAGIGVYDVRWRQHPFFGGPHPVTEHFTITVVHAPIVTGVGSHLLCNGDNNGEITVTGNGGSPPYVYSYSIDGGLSYSVNSHFTGLSANTYYMMVDDGTCYSNSKNVAVTEPSPVAITTIVHDALCNSSNTGEIIINATGGTPPYRYSINGGTFQSNNLFTGLAAGTYQVIANDFNDCESPTSTVIISEPSPITFVTSVVDVLCFGGSNGEITVFPNGGIPPYLYSNDGGISFQGSNHFTGLSGGTFDIVVRDAHNCLYSKPVTVNQPLNDVSFTTNIIDVLCYGDATGEIIINAGGGVGPYQYSRDGGSTFQASNTFTGLIAGNYDVMVRDANLCVSNISSLEISQPSGYLTYTVDLVDIDCYGGANGSITLNATGGTSPYYYSIDNGINYQSNNIFSNLTAGVYGIRVKDANDCITNANSVTLHQPGSAISFNYSTIDVSCYGGSDGEINVIASGGTPPYSYSLNGGSTYQASNNFAGLAASSYDVVVKDANNCVSFHEIITILQPLLSLSFTYTSTDIVCYGDNTGEIQITAVGGTPTYEYSHNGGSTYQASNSFTNLVAGNYPMMIRDANNCTYGPITVNINQPSANLTFTTVVSDAQCYGDPSGQITVLASGGTAPYWYSIDNGISYQSSNIFTNLVAGVYQVRIKDANNCESISMTENVGQPSTPINYTTNTNDVNCYGGASGEIIVNASGGTPPFLYSLNAGVSFQTSNIFTNLVAGDYSVIVKDAYNCLSATSLVTISQPSNPVGFITNTTHVLCYGESTGVIAVSPSGGTPPYQYSNNNGSTFQNSNVFSGLLAGTYYIAVKDAANCVTNSVSVTVDQPMNSLSFSSSIIHVDCFGQATGEVDITADGGTAPYQYSLNGGVSFQNSNIFPNLLAGVYPFVVKDVNNCISPITSITVTQPDFPIAFTTTTTDAGCYGGSSGSITISASGGSPDYYYSIDGGATFQASNYFSGLSANTYQVMVKDFTNCISLISDVTINQPAAEVTFVTSIIDVNCNGDATGEISISAFGGTPPYMYSIDGGVNFSASNTFAGLTGGDYLVVVKDVNNCLSDYEIVTLLPAGPITFNVNTTDVICHGTSTGQIVVSAQGGTPGYLYSIDDGISYQASNTFNNLPVGGYLVRVKDAHSCESTNLSIPINGPDTPIEFTYSIADIPCYGFSTGFISINATGGTPAYLYSIDGGSTFQASNLFTGLPSGFYSLLVKDAQGCFSPSEFVNIDQPSQALSFTTNVIDILCNGDASGTIEVIAAGGTPPYNYSINGGVTYQATPVFDNLVGGTYLVKILDGNLCESSIGTVIVDEPALELSFSNVVTDVQCYGGADGIIEVIASGGTAPYQYSKNGGATYQISSIFNNLVSGTYQIMIKDAHNCISDISTEFVDSPSELPNFSTNTTNVLCHGSNTGEIIINANGGFPPYTYSINGGLSFQSFNTFSNLYAGSYDVMIRDSHLCNSLISMVTLSEPSSSISFTVSTVDVECYGYNSGELIINASGGNPPYTYSINGGTTYQVSNLFENLLAGTYNVLVKDASLCVSSISLVTIAQPTSAVSFTTVLTPNVCFGEANGSIVVNAYGGSAPYTYSIDNGLTYQPANIFNSLFAGTYELVVKDEYDCTHSDIVIITEPDQLVSNIIVNDVSCFGGNDGSIEILMNGGLPPYQYSIDAGVNYQLSNMFIDLPAGFYYVWVQDANFCLYQENIEITEPNSLPDASFTGLDLYYCVNNGDVSLVGSQAPHGIFSGPGIISQSNGIAIFNPQQAGVGGPYTITYTYTSSEGCSNSSSQETEVYNIPTVSFTIINSEHCIDDPSVLLIGNHAPEGMFSGAGIVDNGDGTALFTPAAAGVGGPYSLNYEYTDGNLCHNTSTQYTSVNPLPLVNFSGLDSDYCVDAIPVLLIGNHAPDGSFMGPGIADNGDGTATFDPGLAGIGSNLDIFYTYTNEFFCQNQEYQTVNIHALPSVSIFNLDLVYCVNDEDVIINGNPIPNGNSNGYFTGQGITDLGDGTAIFSPSALSPSNMYTITYTYEDENLCEATANVEVSIIDIPAPPMANDILVCFGEPVPNLTATGEPGFQLIWYNSVGDSVFSGNSYPTGLTAVGDYYFSVTQTHNNTGCLSNPRNVLLSISELPIVSLPEFADVCIYDYPVQLNTANPQGGAYSGNSGIIVLPNGDYEFQANLAGPGLHDIIYTYIDSLTGCQDTAVQSIMVHDRPIVEIIDLESVYCISGADVIIHGNHPGEGVFSGPGIIDYGDGSALFSPSSCTTGEVSILYEYYNVNTGCMNQDTAICVVEGPPENVALIQISDPVICANIGGYITMEAIGGSGTWVNWFENSCEGQSLSIVSANSDSSVIVIEAPSVSTYYYAQWQTECGVSDICAENYIVVNQIPTPADTSWITPNIICFEEQDSIVLYITGGNFGDLLEWTKDSCDGAVVGQSNGDPIFIPAPDTTTTYFSKWINDCGESACSEQVRVFVSAPPQEVALADADSNYFCAYTLDVLELRSFGGIGDTVIWHYDSLGYNPIPLDSIIAVTSNVGDTIEIIPPTVNTTYYPFRGSMCGQEGGNVAVPILVFTDPVAPESAYTSPSVICFGDPDPISLVAIGGHGESLEWYAGDCDDGVFLGNGNNLQIIPPVNTTTYYARWTTPCGISECVETQLIVYPPTIDPISISSDTNEICAGIVSEIQLIMVGGSGDSVIWFSDSCAGTPIDPSSFYYQSPMRDTIIIPAPLTDTTFYAYWATPCETSACVNIDITVYPQPIIMDSLFSSHNNFCSGSVENITLTALGGEGNEISWTIGSCDGPVIAVSSANSVLIPSPQDTTVYYAKWKTVCDSTACKAIQINVPPTPQNPDQILIMENLICDNTIDSITLVLEGGNGFEVIWFNGANCGGDTIPSSEINYLSANGDSIRIARPTQTQTITANWASYNNTCGSSDCVSLDVFVYEAPFAYFEISGGVECENTLLQFSPISDPGSGLITELSWNFGDGTSIDTNLQVDQFHAYESTGDYLVELIITNTFGCQDTSIMPLIISEAPEAAFSYEAACFGQATLFFDESISAVDSIAAWFWNFNDPMSINDTSSMQNPNYTYTQTGVYEVILTITDTSGCVGEIIQEVIVSPGPTAFFNVTNASCQNDPVFFNDSSFTENNQIGTWIWNFGDGSPDTVVTYPNNPDISHIYSGNGQYTVSLQVIDTTGCNSEYFYRYFEVRPTPIADFMTTDTACQTGIIHFFDNTYHQPGTNATAWEWNFDDGTYAYSQNPVHSYIQTGEFYNVQMIVTDDYGCQDTANQQVEVQPSIQIAFQTNTVCQGEATQFIAQLIQPENEAIAEWQWFFGDNSDTIVQTDTISHRYDGGGTFYATLIGVDAGGCETIVINQAVNVYPAPVVDYHIPEAFCNDPSIFYNHSIANAESIILFHFDYGDGTYETFTPDNYPDPVLHNYPAGANEYYATITLTNSNGCAQTTEFLVERESCITTSFIADLPACVGQEVQFINSYIANDESVIVDTIIWQFGDGVIYELPIELGDTVYHAYQTPGVMTVNMKLKASNEYGYFSVANNQTFYVNESPVADFRVSESLLCSRDSLHFSDQSWVFNGEIVTWKWNFNDQFGEYDKSTLRNPAYMYSYGGEYDPHLVVMSDSGCYSTKEKSVSLHSAPVNHLYAAVEFGCGPENEIVFRDTSYLANGSIDYHQWVFGFNDTVYTQTDSLLHQLDIGSYNVISRVVSDVGCVGTDSIGGFNVFDTPIADFGFYPDDPTIKEPEVMFNDKSIGTEVPVEYYHWDFGDGSDTLGLDPFHIFQDTGSFKVILTVMDQNGCVDTMSNLVYVDPVYSFYMPNAFSPNGNGLNDVFGPVGSYFEDKNYEFYIYSRWGELLFESYEPTVMWEGDYAKTSRNQVPLGVYSWFIRVKDALGSEHVYKGFVTVVR